MRLEISRVFCFPQNVVRRCPKLQELLLIAWLFAESTKAYIDSWMIRLLFRHPMEVQRTAAEYLAMIRGAGFAIDPRSISYPYLWWSRADLGIKERWFGIKPPAIREETLINLVAVRP